MANPRRSIAIPSESSDYSISNPTSSSSFINNVPLSSSSSSFYYSISIPLFFRKPHALPLLLLCLILLTWVTLKFHKHYPFEGHVVSHELKDEFANLKRFNPSSDPKLFFRDHRGWLLDPVVAANEAGILGGASSCSHPHVGQIRPGGVRGNHRHHTCNETFIIWGAATKFRLENVEVDGKGYAEVTIHGDEVAVAASPQGTAHALINVDRVRPTYFLGCQDALLNYSSSSDTDFNVWKDL